MVGHEEECGDGAHGGGSVCGLGWMGCGKGGGDWIVESLGVWGCDGGNWECDDGGVGLEGVDVDYGL